MDAVDERVRGRYTRVLYQIKGARRSMPIYRRTMDGEAFKHFDLKHTWLLQLNKTETIYTHYHEILRAEVLSILTCKSPLQRLEALSKTVLGITRLRHRKIYNRLITTYGLNRLVTANNF